MKFECAMYQHSLPGLNNTPTYKKWELSHKGQDVYTRLKNQHLAALSSFSQAAAIYAPTDRLSSYLLVPITAYYVPLLVNFQTFI